jgi:membrane protein DedA with SNARE-associated domain
MLAARALEACHRAGAEVVIKSGRRRAQVMEDARLLGQTSYIFEVGTGMVIDGELTFLTGELQPRDGLTVHEQIERTGAPALLLARLIPLVPYSLVGYLAGAARVPVWRYTWTSFAGVLPITAAATYLGHALGDLSASDPLLWAAIGVLLLLGVLTATAARRLHKATR